MGRRVRYIPIEGLLLVAHCAPRRRPFTPFASPPVLVVPVRSSETAHLAHATTTNKMRGEGIYP
eukprot:8662240-Pyramimonas_sp.AAC.1